MGKPETITTGVDNLVSLVTDKKRISLNDASKTLGVPAALIEEWADFLEEKGVIKLEYKFTTPYLVYREADSKTVAKNTKMFATKRETFLRQVDMTLQFIEKHSAGLQKVKTEFDKINADLEGKVKAIQSELKELDRFDSLKRDLGSELNTQYGEFRKRMEGIEKRVHEDEKAYESILTDLRKSQSHLDDHTDKLEDIRKAEAAVIRKLSEVNTMIADLRAQERSEESRIEKEKHSINRLKHQAKRLEGEIVTHTKALKPLLNEFVAATQKSAKAKDAVMQGFDEHLKRIELKESKATQVRQSFEKYLKQKINIDILMDRLTSEIRQLEVEFRLLKQEGKVLSATSRDSAAEKDVDKLQKRLEEALRNKERFEKNVIDLKETIESGESRKK